MSPERLLERIEQCDRSAAGRGRDEERTLQSVLAHLRRLLNTRQGNVPLAADYGAPDFLTMLQSFPESVTAMEGAIRSTIEKYEPRLSEVQVLFKPEDDNALTLHFEIVAALAGAPPRRLSFQSSVDIQGKVQITTFFQIGAGADSPVQS